MGSKGWVIVCKCSQPHIYLSNGEGGFADFGDKRWRFWPNVGPWATRTEAETDMTPEYAGNLQQVLPYEEAVILYG